MYLMKVWLKFSEPGTSLVVQCFHCRGHRFRTWPGNYLPKVIKIMRWGMFLDYLDHSAVIRVLIHGTWEGCSGREGRNIGGLDKRIQDTMHCL